MRPPTLLPLPRLPTPRHLSTFTHCRPIHPIARTRNSNMDMDITSGNVSFGRTCPGVLMEDLRLNTPSDVANIKTLQLSLSRSRVFDLCAVGCPDLSIVRNFISSITSLEELSVINYEQDASSIWPAIFQQGESLRSLGIHSPLGIRAGGVWTGKTTSEVINGLPKLERLELDLKLEEAEGLLNQGVDGADDTGGETQGETRIDSVIEKLAKAKHQLQSLLVNVNLPNGANIFADAHTYNAYGPTSFGQHHQEPREQLALKIFEKMAVLKQLELRFPRRSYEDRGQFWTIASSVHARRNEKGVVCLETMEVKEYLPKWPEYGGILWSLM